MAYVVHTFVVHMLTARVFKVDEQEQIAHNIRAIIRDNEKKLLSKPDYSILEVHVTAAAGIELIPASKDKP